MDGGDEEKAQAETGAAVAVADSDDLEAFEHGDDVLASAFAVFQKARSSQSACCSPMATLIASRFPACFEINKY